MKKILVPTDFSDNAKDAFLYAQELANHFDAQITVTHIYHPSASHFNEFTIPTGNELLEMCNKKLSTFASKNTSNSNENIMVSEIIEQKLELGFAADKLVEMSKSGEYDLIVMGSTGTSGVLEKVFGKVSLMVSQKAECPVLLIPLGTKFMGVKEIMFASEYEIEHGNIMLEIENFSKLLSANIHLVHVYDKLEKLPNGLGHFLLEKAFQLNAPSTKFTMDSVMSDSVAHGIEEFAEKNKMDWMVIVKPHRNLWQRLTHKSETNEMIMNPKIPLMVMH